ncbi:hypothetical protein [Mucilaginibacter lacusdianchii]|uniref:hypothetical protein n=1 Tax=Mucilaginibacter lacusdianchii TaxID=2684211 RepID=UPI00131A8120|nr:hypothetical protein [Mucilaginibacter sp. JXJ CY 39]
MGYDEVQKESDLPSISGQYLLSGHSRKMMKYEGNYQHIPPSELVLASDHTYQLHNAPDWMFNDFGEPHGQYTDKIGRWNLTCNNDGCLIELEGLMVTPLYMRNHKAAILITVGDGDECQGMVYEKVSR